MDNEIVYVDAFIEQSSIIDRPADATLDSTAPPTFQLKEQRETIFVYMLLLLASLSLKSGARLASIIDPEFDFLLPGHNSREQTRTTGSVGGMEWGVQEARTENEPGEDRSDGWTPERGVEQQVGW